MGLFQDSDDGVVSEVILSIDTDTGRVTNNAACSLVHSGPGCRTVADLRRHHPAFRSGEKKGRRGRFLGIF
jgi:hypothetical protein